MQWVGFIVVVILIFLTDTLSASTKQYICDGKFKDGGKPDQDELEKILKDHKAWLLSESNKSDTRRANLCGANLKGVNLSKADLSEANLFGAFLHKIKLSGANLRGADLSEAQLSKANLTKAFLDNALMSEASLSRADLQGASLYEVDLSNAWLDRTNLSGAKLGRGNLSKATLFRASLNGADLHKANLSEAYLFRASMRRANLDEANFTRANLTRADLSEANLLMANLTGANLSGALLIKAELVKTNINNADFTDINLEKATYEPHSVPDKSFLAGILNLDTVQFSKDKQSGLVLLRNSLKESGLREMERIATYVIEKSITDHNSSLLEKYFRRLFYELTAEYGRSPERCLKILLSGIPIFSLFYFCFVYRKIKSPLRRKNGIYRIWSDDRILKESGSNEPELITAGILKSITFAFYFSVLSAFHIGWRDINASNWIARIQWFEYTLSSTGWVRTVSGIQSLISIYLLAFWVLTQFGRPFG